MKLLSLIIIIRVTVLIPLIDILINSLTISINKVIRYNLEKNLKSLTTCVIISIFTIHIYLKSPLINLKFKDINIYILILYNST